MTNYSEMLKATNNINKVKEIVDNLNNSIKDNEKIIFNFADLDSTIKAINEDNKTSFSKTFAYSVKIDRIKAFADILKTPFYDVYSIVINDDKTYTIKDSTRLFSFSDIEKEFQMFCSTETDKNGKAIRNKGVTVFGALRFYGLTSVFIRNLQKVNFEIDTDKAYNLENVVVDTEKVFAKGEGECFSSNSNNALEKQLNIIAKFFSYDVKLLKKDLPILKLKAQKIKQDKKNAQFTVNAVIDDNTVLKFADVIFGVIASRIQGKDIEVITTKPTKE